MLGRTLYALNHALWGSRGSNHSFYCKMITNPVKKSTNKDLKTLYRFLTYTSWELYHQIVLIQIDNEETSTWKPNQKRGFQDGCHCKGANKPATCVLSCFCQSKSLNQLKLSCNRQKERNTFNVTSSAPQLIIRQLNYHQILLLKKEFIMSVFI